MNRVRREWLLFLLLTLFLGLLKCLQHYTFQTHDYDTGVYSNVVWNLSQGSGFFNAILQRNQLGNHFSPIVAIFAPFYLVSPSPCIILIGQAMAVTLALAFLYQIARHLVADRPEHDQNWFALTMLLLAFFYLPVQSALLFEFHPSTLGMPLVAGAILCLHRRKWVLYGVALVALFSTKELAIISALGLALYAGAVLKNRFVMFATTGVALGLGYIILQWAMPAFRSQSHYEYYSRVGVLALPLLKVKYLFLLLLYLGFLPLCAPLALLAAAPNLIVNLIVKEESQLSLLYHYDDQTSIFLIIAAMHGLLRLWTWTRARTFSWPVWPQLRWVVTGILVIIALCGSGDRLRQELRPIKHLAEIRALHQHLAPYKALPQETGIITQNGLGPHFCHRPHYSHFDQDYFGRIQDRPGDYLLLARSVDHYQVDFEEALKRLDADPRFKAIEHSDVLDVYQIK